MALRISKLVRPLFTLYKPYPQTAHKGKTGLPGCPHKPLIYRFFLLMVNYV